MSCRSSRSTPKLSSAPTPTLTFWSAPCYRWRLGGRILGVAVWAEIVVGCSRRSSLNGVAEEPREGCTNRCSERRKRKEKLGGVAALLDDMERRRWRWRWCAALRASYPYGPGEPAMSAPASSGRYFRNQAVVKTVLWPVDLPISIVVAKNRDRPFSNLSPSL
ncbi:hypothetical protein FA15DRAFT_661823 [Coprinopsis marcescibilis]|uniref:Uncharacterized protein n=1 Tax=Coprinopsis marcescibilis TaxID=230819 RepID=A0A5C3KA08_COPMA|nr:hypothetical protein FA15DRAFT_661823 [Coprinopsis marcescibilis]